MSCKTIYTYCRHCGDKAWINDNHELHHSGSNIDYVDIQGVFVAENFITREEEAQLLPVIDSIQPWISSQEGRAKQDYGPKVSFLKRKVAIGDFHGFPDFAINLFQRMQAYYPNVMDGFVPVEFCLLEYVPERGSYIRPHYDDTWIWGDRLVTLNLISDTVLRLTKEFKLPPYDVVIKMPSKSLVVIYGDARYNWHHSINRYDIKSRRIAMTWREFGEQILKEEEHQEFVAKVLTIAKQSKIISGYKCLLNSQKSIANN